MYYAHSGPTHEAWEPLRDHLRDVAERAASFAEAFGAAEEARLAGILHDLGKYCDRFNQRLAGKAPGMDHWSAGAWAAARCGHAAVAFAIHGHHAGLQDPDALRALWDVERLAANHPLRLELTHSDFPALLARLEADGLSLPTPASSLFDAKGRFKGAGMLDVRMLFSALVDADFLETEAHFQRDAAGRKVHRPEAPPLTAAEALARLDAHLAGLRRDSRAAPEVEDRSPRPDSSRSTASEASKGTPPATTVGLLPHLQAALLARTLRGDLDGCPPFLWKWPRPLARRPDRRHLGKDPRTGSPHPRWIETTSSPPSVTVTPCRPARGRGLKRGSPLRVPTRWEALAWEMAEAGGDGGGGLDPLRRVLQLPSEDAVPAGSGREV